MTALVTMRNDILWRCSIFQPLPILTPSWEQNVPGVLPAEPLAVLQSWLPPMHVLQGCTPTARAFCRPLPTWLALSLSGTGPSNYKSNYLHKLSQKPRGRNFIYQNTPLSGENDKKPLLYQNICVIVLDLSWKLDLFETAASLLCSLFRMGWDEVSLYLHFLSTWGWYGDLISSPHVNQAKPDCLPYNILRKYFIPLQLLASLVSSCSQLLGP